MNPKKTTGPRCRVVEGKRNGDFLIYGQAAQDLKRIAKLEGVSVNKIFNRCIRLGIELTEAEARKGALQ